MEKERRAHKRAKPEQPYDVVCFSSDPNSSKGRGFNLAERLVDLSKTGLCIVTVGRLRVGLPLYLEIFLPGDKSRFRADAVVRWSETVESKGRLRKTAHVAGLEIERVLEARGEKLGPLVAWVDHKTAGATPEPRRRHKRFTLANAELICSPSGFMSRLTLGSNLAKKLRNLSQSGAQIVSSRKLEVGQRVVLKLTLKPRTTLVAEGEVLWCKRDTLILEPTWYVGIGFRNVTPDDQSLLRALEKMFTG